MKGRMVMKMRKVFMILFTPALFTGVIYSQEISPGDSSLGTEQEVTPSASETQEPESLEPESLAPETQEPAVEANAPEIDSAKAEIKDKGTGEESGEVVELEKQVIIGYGSVKKKDLTGAVATIEKSEINKSAVLGIERALQGKAAGITVTQNSGSPGAKSMVRIRGFGTVNASEPLYIVDGVPIRNGDISFLNPNDIESISILKDASSAAIYGTRGLNGVILITMKKAKEKALSDSSVGISCNTFFGSSQPWKSPNLCNAEEWKTLKLEAIKNHDKGDTTGYGAVSAVSGPGTDWWKEITRESAITQRHDASIMNATDNMQFFLSGSYATEEGIIKGTDAGKATIHAQGENKPTEWLTMGFNTVYNNNVIHPIVEGDEDLSVLSNMYNVTPASPVRAGAADTLAPDRFNNRLNPVGRIEHVLEELTLNRLLTTLNAKLYIANTLTFASSFGFDLDFVDTAHFEPKYFISSQVGNNNPSAIVRRVSETGKSFYSENNLTFDKTFADNHTLKVLAGVSTEDNNTEFVMAENKSLPSNDSALRYLHATMSTTDKRVDGYEYGNSLLSFLGRASYEFASKYLLTLSLRRDGSSRFGPDNRWGNFPSAALAWKLNEEKFMESLTFIQLLKLRAGYGVLGNQAFDDYKYMTNASPGQDYYIGGKIIPGVAFLGMGNSGLKWEEQKASNIGLDLAALQSKLEFSGDYFNKTTSGMLLQSPISAIAGLQQIPWTNGGEIKNTGFDASASYTEKIGGFSGKLSANFSHYKNEVMKLSENAGEDEAILSGSFRGRYISRTAVGHSVGEFYGYKTNGLFQTQAECDAASSYQPGAKPGDVRYMDDDHDGKWDQDYIGSPHPLFTYGGGLSGAHEGGYGSFDFNLFLQGSYGNKIFNAVRTFTNTSTAYFNEDKRMLDRWTGPGSTNDASLPRMNASDVMNTDQISDVYVEDGSYMRLKDFQIGYTLPKNFFNIRKQLRIYAGVQNLLTLTGYSGLDPEVGLNTYKNDPNTNRRDPLDIGIDRGTYPQSRTIYSGLNISF
jgi:TonB-linked SusC/RagA family outer membrane protein